MTTLRAVMLEAAREELVTCGQHLAEAVLSARVVAEFLWSAWKAGDAVAKLKPMPRTSTEAEERWAELLRSKPFCPLHGDATLDCGRGCPFNAWGHA